MSGSDSSATPAGTARPQLGALTIFIFALATGSFAANMYLSQPLIEMIGEDLGIKTSLLGTIVMLPQIGFALGMFFIGPVADVTENKRLILISTALVVAGQLAVGLAITPLMFLLASFFVGLAAIGTQIIVPLAANLASDEKRGAQIGTIMAGLLVGIMLARPVSSFFASLWGWRAPFLFSAALMTGIGILLAIHTPRFTPSTKSRYLSLLKTMIVLPLRSASLRRRSIYQGIAFGVFNMFWTSSSLVLTDVFGLNYREIALFALAGAGGALIAPHAGRLADNGRTRIATGVALTTLLLCMLMSIQLVDLKYLIVFAGVAVIVDAAVQANQVLGQATIYANLPESRARANAFYMTSLFVGAGIGSLIAPVCYDLGGWTAVAIVASGFTFIGLLYWATEYMAPGKSLRKSIP